MDSGLRWNNIVDKTGLRLSSIVITGLVPVIHERGQHKRRRGLPGQAQQ